MMKQNKPYNMARKILALLLAAVLTVVCTGCSTTLFIAEGSEKLDSEPIPDRATSGQMWYTFPFTAEQANAVFFGDRDCQPFDSFCGYQTVPNPYNKKALWYFTTETSVEYGDSKTEAVLGGAHNSDWMHFQFLDTSQGTTYYGLSIAFEPESGALLDAITYHPTDDAVYEQVLTDSATKLKTLGYTDAAKVFSSKIDLYAMRILGRTRGYPVESGTSLEHYYVVRYTLQSADTRTIWADALLTNHMATATFYYNAEGGLFTAIITTVPECEVMESAEVRYTAEEAFQLLPGDWYRTDCTLVDAYLEPVRTQKDSAAYDDCWTFRFVALPEIYQMSDTRAESMLGILGISGRYLEMQCHVNARTGEVTGGEWVYSNHLIHEYNSKQQLLK
ncbi:MAG: hypothetical protein IJY28_03775 [Clostridia bacterium]|nr:hypothetical protein [Clostridia bacterium]